MNLLNKYNDIIKLTPKEVGCEYVGTFIWFRIGSVECCCQHGNENSANFKAIRMTVSMARTILLYGYIYRGYGVQNWL